jgi:hypothetical protein
MSKLDFPNPPLTIGQQATLTNGITYQWDGEVWFSLSTGRLYLMAGALAGSPPAALSCGFYVSVFTATFPAVLTGSQGYAKTAPAAQADCAITLNGAAMATMRFAAGAHTATFLLASATVIHPGDRIEVLSPGTVDLNFADFTWTLEATL